AHYVDDGRLPGWLLVVSRGGRTVHLSTYGQRDKEASLPVELDTIFRFYSMTKPITSVAAMMLYEQGAFELTGPVGRYIPDVRGRLVEVVSGMPLDEFFRTRIFEPLGMGDSGFFVPDTEHHRLAALYFPEPGSRRATRLDAMGNAALTPPNLLSGGGGLVG